MKEKEKFQTFALGMIAYDVLGISWLLLMTDSQYGYRSPTLHYLMNRPPRTYIAAGPFARGTLQICAEDDDLFIQLTLEM